MWLDSLNSIEDLEEGLFSKKFVNAKPTLPKKSPFTHDPTPPVAPAVKVDDGLGKTLEKMVASNLPRIEDAIKLNRAEAVADVVVDALKTSPETKGLANYIAIHRTNLLNSLANIFSTGQKEEFLMNWLKRLQFRYVRESKEAQKSKQSKQSKLLENKK